MKVVVLKEKFLEIVKKAKQKKLFLLFSAIYNFAWAICKILLGVFNYAYFFCVSGASTLLFGFIKKIYLQNHNSDDEETKRGKSITIAIMTIISASLFSFYMARLFFIDDFKDYGLILSITIATFSFTEFGLSLYYFFKAKKSDDIMLQSFKGCTLASSCFAIVLTQVALLSATESTNNFLNGLTGVGFGFISIVIGIYVLIKSIKYKAR